MDLFLNNVRAALGPHGEGYESTIDAILALRAKVESAVEVQTVTLCDKHGMEYVKGCDDCAADLEMLTVMGPPEDVNPAPSTSEEAQALAAARDWIGGAAHGDNCFVSNHYEGDPGAGCNCGKESVLQLLDEATPADESGAGEDAARCKHERSHGAPWRCAKCGYRFDDAARRARGEANG